MALLSKSLFFILASLFLIARSDFTHTCSHDHIEQNPEFLDIEEDTSAFQASEGRVLASSSPFRIQANFDFLKSSAPSSYASYIINDLVPPIVDYFESALRVRAPVVGSLKLASNIGSVCGKKTPSILKSGVNADFFYFYDSERDGGTVLANTKFCYLASGTKRPLIVHTVINRNNLQEANGDVLMNEKNMYVLMHEFMHALGFSDSNYKYYIDSNGKKLSGHIKSVKIGGNTRKVIDVAPLTSRLRDHFGCSSLQGAIMENGGGQGTSSSHFERRYFVYETMASGSVVGRRVSDFSLAMLEGSGWYTPDYSYAEPYFFGQGQGCNFISDSCSQSNTIFEEFCSSSSRGCAPHGRGGGFCSTDPVSDGCKYYSPQVEYDCENNDGEDWARLPDLQVFGRGAGSRCFEGDLNSRKSSNGKTSFCFKYTCEGSGSNTELHVQVGNDKITCQREGSMEIDGYYGSLQCPDPLTFCQTVGKKFCPRNCMGRGTCVNNQCKCNSGYTGTDCALRD